MAIANSKTGAAVQGGPAGEANLFLIAMIGLALFSIVATARLPRRIRSIQFQGYIFSGSLHAGRLASSAAGSPVAYSGPTRVNMRTA